LLWFAAAVLMGLGTTRVVRFAAAGRLPQVPGRRNLAFLSTALDLPVLAVTRI